jgi:chloramphenicol 3-O-phosphotransferase
MNLIFLYGPPASGKLTIAQHLSKLTRYPVFHNHLTRDLVQHIYPGAVMENYGLVNTLREDIMRYCAQRDTSLIFTFVYDGPEDDDVVAERVSTVTENGGQVRFVELTAPQDVLLARVANESRRQQKKIVDRELLSALLKDKSYTSVPYEPILKIDTSRMEPIQAARFIARHYQLI